MNIFDAKIVAYPPTNKYSSFLISCTAQDNDRTYDFTGDKALVFPDCLMELGHQESKAQVYEWAIRHIQKLIEKKRQQYRLWPEHVLMGRRMLPNPNGTGVNPTSDKCVVSLAVGRDGTDQLDISGPLFKAYAERIGADYHPIILEDSAFPVAEKFRVREYLDDYARVIFFDADVVLAPDAEDLFALVPEESIGLHDDYPYIKDKDAHAAMMAELVRCQNDPLVNSLDLNVSWNSGVMVMSAMHIGMFDPPTGPLPWEHMSEQNWMNVNVVRNGFTVEKLPRKWNWQWKMNEEFPDPDPTGVRAWHAAGLSDIDTRLDWMESKVQPISAR